MFNNIIKIVQIVEQFKEANSALNRKQVGRSQKLKEDVSQKNFEILDHLLLNAAKLQTFCDQVAREFPRASPSQQKEMVSGLLIKYLKDKYDGQEKKYTDLDMECMKTVCFQRGLNLQKHSLKGKLSKSFFVGLLAGSLLVYMIIKMI